MVSSKFEAIEHQYGVFLSEENSCLVYDTAAHADVTSFRQMRQVDHFIAIGVDVK